MEKDYKIEFIDGLWIKKLMKDSVKNKTKTPQEKIDNIKISENDFVEILNEELACKTYFSAIEQMMRPFKIFIIEEAKLVSTIEEEIRRIEDIIQNYIFSLEFEYDDRENINYIFQHKIFENEITINAHLLFFNNIATWKKYKMEGKVQEIYNYNKETKTLETTTIVFNHKDIFLNSNFTGLHQEIKYCYLYSKELDNATDLDEENHKTVLSSFIEFRKNKIGVTPSEEYKYNILDMVSTIIYLCSKEKRQLCAIELYNEFKNRSPINYKTILSTCNSYRIFKKMQDDIDYIAQHKDDIIIQEEIKKYKFKNIDDFFKFAHRGFNLLANILAKAMCLYCYDQREFFEI